jgi:hypothetical protein
MNLTEEQWDYLMHLTLNLNKTGNDTIQMYLDDDGQWEITTLTTGKNNAESEVENVK